MSTLHKYVEKDAALLREDSQPVQVEGTHKGRGRGRSSRGVVGAYEKHHNVSVTEEARFQGCFQPDLSERYINDRNLPDKAIDVIDEACAAVRLRSTGKHQENVYKMIQDEIAASDKPYGDALSRGKDR